MNYTPPTTSRRQDRVSQRVAVLVIFATSLVLWIGIYAIAVRQF
jgi:hypothetical protein